MTPSLTQIWNMPRSEAKSHYERIFKANILLPASEREARYTVRIEFDAVSQFEHEANSEKEAIDAARESLESELDGIYCTLSRINNIEVL